MPTHAIPRRGEVWLINFDPTIGHEVKKTRPALIVTDDTYNEFNWVVLAVPLTSRDHAKYNQVLVGPPEGGLSNRSVVLPDQLRAIDRKRLLRKLGELSDATMKQVDRSLRIVLSL